MLLDRRHNVFAGFERNMLFLILNLGELTLLTAILFRAFEDFRSPFDAWASGLFATTLVQLPMPDGRYADRRAGS